MLARPNVFVVAYLATVVDGRNHYSSRVHQERRITRSIRTTSWSVEVLAEEARTFGSTMNLARQGQSRGGSPSPSKVRAPTL